MCINRRKLIDKHVVMSRKKMQEFDFQKRIQELMDGAGIKTQYELASICGVERPVVTRWMKKGNELRYSSIKMICKAFDITVPQFFENGFVDRRGDGPTKLLRNIWKTMTETEKLIFVKNGKSAVEIFDEVIAHGDKDSSFHSNG